MDLLEVTFVLLKVLDVVLEWPLLFRVIFHILPYKEAHVGKCCFFSRVLFGKSKFKKGFCRFSSRLLVGGIYRVFNGFSGVF